MKKALHYIILTSLLIYSCCIKTTAQNTDKPDKKTIQVHSYVDDRIGIYYKESGELIGYAPITLEKKKLKSPFLLIKGDQTEDVSVNVPVKDLLELNIRPINDSRIPASSFVHFEKLNELKINTYEVFVHPKYDKKQNRTRVNLTGFENKIKRKAFIGRHDETKTYAMVDEGMAYDPIFGTSRNMRTQLCNILYANYFDVTRCEEVINQENLSGARRRMYVSIKPVLSEYAFKIFATRYDEDYFNYGYYNLKMTYELSLADDQKKEIIIMNAGFYNANDPNALFNKALYDNVSIFLTDTAMINMIEESNEVFLKQNKADKIEAKHISPKYADLKEVIKTSTKSVVTIEGDDKSFGSGFMINDHGYILTNYHVIDDSKKLTVKIGKDTTSYTARLIRYDDLYDLAVVKIELEHTPYLMLKKEEEAEVGDLVIAIGTPGAIGLGQSVSKGIVSGNRTIDNKAYIQTDVSINPGNSGGPLLNEQGEVIGIVVMKMIGRGLEGLGFAIPASKAIEMMNISYQ